jgi:tRNA pseudouridine55 synthase
LSAILGFINVHKPVGPTSTQVTAQVRRIFSLLGGSKIAAGHLGTLDPAASGVLPIALGKATRLIPLIEDRRKEYVCTLVLGRSTTTGDALGETVRETPIPADAAALLKAVLPRFIGAVEQIPPMFSAVHYAGKRLYDLAREGITVDRAPRTVTIHDVRLLDGNDEKSVLRLRVACGEGTYIRTLCEDIGAAMGLAAHMGSLVREVSGPFALEKSSTLEEITANPLKTLLAPDAVISFPAVTLDARGTVDFCAGRAVTSGSQGFSGHVFVRDGAHALLGIGEAQGSRIAPRKVLV